jgi:GT2 family glycosyltransferase
VCSSDLRIEQAPGNIGFAAGSNLGARGATAPWLAMLNPDTRAAPDWLAELRAATLRHPGTRLFGSTQLDGDNPKIVDGFGDTLSAYGMAWRNLGGQAASELPEQDCEVFSPCAAAALYARPAFEAARGFDESFFCYLEDVDLGFRLRLNGESCVQVRRAEILHKASSIAGRMSAFSMFHSYRNRIWLLAKDMPLLLLGPAIIGWSAATILSLVRPRARPYRGAAFRGTFAGIKGLPRALAARAGVQSSRLTRTMETARMLVWNPLKRLSARPKP